MCIFSRISGLTLLAAVISLLLIKKATFAIHPVIEVLQITISKNEREREKRMMDRYIDRYNLILCVYMYMQFCIPDDRR